MLNAKDPTVVKATIDTLDRLGSAAAPARTELEKIVKDDGPDKELTKAAAAVIAKIDSH
jgi:hypothetical protein